MTPELILTLYISIAVVFAFLLIVILLTVFNKRVLRRMKLKSKLLFYFFPLSILFLLGQYYIFYVQPYEYEWLMLLGLFVIYILFYAIVLALNLRPINKISFITKKLAEKDCSKHIDIVGSQEFYNINNNLIQIKQNILFENQFLLDYDRELYKFIPKQFFDILKKKNLFELSLGTGVQCEVSVLFCDIRDSFKISESMSLEENFKMINNYLSIVARATKKYDGFVDKYLGDGAISIFLNADGALYAANEIAKELENINMVSVGKEKIQFGMAIHTGKVIMGIIGEKNRLSPTIISDSVNLASRLEKINKLFGTKIIFTKETLNTLSTSSDIHYRYLGTLELDGDNEIVALFESLDCFIGKRREVFISTASDFENAVRTYEKKDYQKAKALFSRINQDLQDDVVTKIYLKKCNMKLKQYYRKNKNA